MNEYVIVIGIGPVQTFIAAARRSRDLWRGSWLLSELSKACALSLQEAGATLIFPAPTRPDALIPGSDFAVGNKLQATLAAENDTALRAIAANARHGSSSSNR